MSGPTVRTLSLDDDTWADSSALLKARLGDGARKHRRWRWVAAGASQVVRPPVCSGNANARWPCSSLCVELARSEACRSHAEPGGVRAGPTLFWARSVPPLQHPWLSWLGSHPATLPGYFDRSGILPSGRHRICRVAVGPLYCCASQRHWRACARVPLPEACSGVDSARRGALNAQDSCVRW